MNTLDGKRLCGAVKYKVEGAFEYAMNCHCYCRNMPNSLITKGS